MWTCVVCHFQFHLDDVEIGRPNSGACICVKCAHRLAGNELRTNKRLRDQLIQTLNALEGTF